MTIEQAIDLLREAMMVTLTVVGPILVCGLVIGLTISLIQAITQIQDQTLTFVPKIFAMAIAVIIVMPWMFQRLIDYARQLFMMQ